jgi:hypothetical protein
MYNNIHRFYSEITSGSFEVSEITATTHVLFLIFYKKPDMVVTNKIKYPADNGTY